MVSCQLLVVFKSDSWTIQVMTIDKYFLHYSGWKSQGCSERCQCIYMCILLARYMVDVKVSEPLGHVDRCFLALKCRSYASAEKRH